MPDPHSLRFHRRRLPLQAVVLACVVATALSGCSTQEWTSTATQWRDEVLTPRAGPPVAAQDDSTDRSPAPGPTPATAVTAEESAAALQRLPLVERTPPVLAPYRRDAFGPSWSDVEGNGCNQRDDVLLRDAVPGSVVTAPQGRCPHDVLAGAWVDPYSGVRVDLDDLKDRSQAQAVQIDHVVPLAEAWRSGAWAWSAGERLDFANDLSGLVASDGPTNASKSDSDPAAWRPRQRYQCSYAQRWIAVKETWGLGADVSERRALLEMLQTCTNG